MECELEVHGFFSKRFSFKPASSLSILARCMRDFSISRKLADMLSQNASVMALLREVKPDELYIALHSGYASAIAGLLDVEGPMLDFYRNPSEISWIFTLKIPVPVSVIPKEDFMLAYQLLSSVVKVTIAVTIDEAKALGCSLPRTLGFPT